MTLIPFHLYRRGDGSFFTTGPSTLRGFEYPSGKPITIVLPASRNARCLCHVDNIPNHPEYLI